MHACTQLYMCVRANCTFVCVDLRLCACVSMCECILCVCLQRHQRSRSSRTAGPTMWRHSLLWLVGSGSYHERSGRPGPCMQLSWQARSSPCGAVLLMDDLQWELVFIRGTHWRTRLKRFLSSFYGGGEFNQVAAIRNISGDIIIFENEVVCNWEKVFFVPMFSFP